MLQSFNFMDWLQHPSIGSLVALALLALLAGATHMGVRYGYRRYYRPRYYRYQGYRHYRRYGHYGGYEGYMGDGGGGGYGQRFEPPPGEYEHGRERW